MSAPFPLLWHRAGNAAAGLAAVQAARRASAAILAGRPLVHGVELDLKWAREAGRLQLYFHHGPTGRERLSAARARARALRGDALLLEDLLAADGAEALHYLVELKRGDGPPAAAIAELRAAFEGRGLAARTWIAASSLDLLREAALAWPEAPRVLFARSLPGATRVLHLPTTYTRRGLRAFGLAPALAPGAVDVLCTIGVVAKDPRRHRAYAAAAAARGVGYLPGRVTRCADLPQLAADGHAGAFMYAAPCALG